MARINELISNYTDNSEISRFNTNRSTDWYPVSAETALVVTETQRLSALSAGAFDPTIAPALRLWGLGPHPQQSHLPEQQELDLLRTQTGFHHLEVRQDPPALRKEIPDLEIDVSAVGEGFGVDELSKVLENKRCENYLVELGGEIRVRGRRADGGVWTIGIERPSLTERSAQRVLRLSSGAVSTSGVYRNFINAGGRRRSHILDARTLRPVEHDLLSATVMADSCMRADGLATALMALGPDEALRVSQENGIAALLICGDENRPRTIETPAWKRLEAFGGNDGRDD